MNGGFFVPNSNSADFISNQRTRRGSYRWDDATSEVGLQQQAAFQTLSKQYSTTIDNAYSNYLAANRGIRGSQTGQGYKEAYVRQTQQGLQQDIAQSNLNLSEVRQQIGQQASGALGDIQAQFKTEVGNLGRAHDSLGGYFEYLKTLTRKDTPLLKEGQTLDDLDLGYLTKAQMAQSLDTVYESVLNAEPQNYLDESGNLGIRYTDWVRNNLKDNEADRLWSDWLFNYGGLEQFKQALKRGINPL